MHSKLKLHLEMQVLMLGDYEINTGTDTVGKSCIMMILAKICNK